jgi:ribosomal protein S2
MKIKKIQQTKYNLINYNLLKSRSYLGLHKHSLYYLNSRYIKGFKNKFCIFEILKTKNYIKKSLLIIYKYHYFNKKILFVGFPNSQNKKYNILFNQTNHFFIPQSTWINNIILNHYQVIKTFKKNLFSMNNLNSKYFIEICNIKQIPDLIVLYNQTKEMKAFQEILKLKIPLITFLDSSNKSDQIDYKIPGGFINLKSEKFCYLLIKSLLTLPKIKKNAKKKL